MNILYLIDFLGTGGVESYIYTLAKAYGEEHRVFLCYGHEKHGLDKFRQLGIEIVNLPMRRFYDVRAARKLSRLCREYEIDVIHTHFLRENGVAVLSKFFGNRAKIINTRHMLLENRGLTKFVNRQIVRGDKYVIAVSDSVKKLLKDELGDLSKIKKIYTGVDLKRWESCSYDFRKKYKIASDEIVIASTARLSPEKGQEFILKSIPEVLRNTKKKVRFIFIGSGPDEGRLKEMATELDIERQVLFLGYQQDIASILRSSDIFLLCSKSEAFGIAILEAMACELPVIATKTGGITEIIQPQTQVGRLIEYGNKDQLARELVQLIEDEDLRYELGRNGRELVMKEFNLEQTITETFKLYKN